MALSEIRVNTTKTRTGVGTITYTETGPIITGIATASNFKTGSTNVHSTGVELANINTGGSTATFGGAISVGGAISGTSATLSGALSGTTASFSGNVSVGGTLTYEDVTNVDAVGLVTARNGIKVLAGGANVVGVVTATSFVGALPISNDTNNRVLTGTGSGGINGESNLTFDHNQLFINCGNYSYPIVINSTQSSVRAVIRQTNDANANSGLAIQKKHSTLHPANHWYGDISFEGWDGSGYHKGGLIECVANGTPANDNMPGELRFSTNAGGAHPTKILTITKDGKLYHTGGGDGRRYSFAGDGTSHYMKFDSTLNGIILNGYGGIAFETNGTNQRLHIGSDGTITLKNNSGMMMDLQSSAGTGSAWIEFSDTDGTRKGYFGYGSSSSEKVYWVQQKDADMSIYSNGNDRVIVHSNGKVTIGDGNETATAYGANLLVDGGSGTRLTLVGSNSGWGMLSFADASTNTTTQNAGFVYMDHASGDNGPRLTLGTDNTNRLIIRAPGSQRGQVELYGNFNHESTPALEINDGGDARKVYMSNSSGDMAIWTRNASRIGGQLKMNESGHMYYHMQDPDNSANLHKCFQTANYKVASGSTNQSTTRTTQYIIAGGYGGSEGMYHGRTHFEVWANNNDHYQPVAFVPMGYNLDSTSFGGHFFGDVWINQGGSQKPSDFGGTNTNWSTMTAQIKWDCAHWNAKPQMSSVVHYVNVGQASIGRLFFSGTQAMWIGWFQPGHYTVQYRVNKGLSTHSATSAGGSILVRHSSSFFTASSMAYSSRNTNFDSTIMYGGNGSHST